MMTVCRLCLVESPDVIHIFRELGVQLKVSSILSKHFGSLFEVTQEHDEAICSSCWTHTESFHAFYQSIKSAQNCYSSDEDDSSNALQEHHHPQNVKLVMYDSVTGQVIEQRTNDHHYHITYNNAENNGQQHQHDESSTQMHVIEQESYEVCDETTDSDLELLMMMQPHDGTNSLQQPQAGGAQQLHQALHQQHQEHPGIIQIGDDEDEDEDRKVGNIEGQTSSMAPILHIRDRSGGHSNNDTTDDSVSEFLQSNEHVTVIEVSSPSQAQKLLQQQQLQQQQHVVQHQLPVLTSRPVTIAKNRRLPVVRKRKLPIGPPQQLETTQQQLQHPQQQQIQHLPATNVNKTIAETAPADEEDDDNASPQAGGVGEPYRMQCDLCSKTFKTFHRVQSHYQLKHNMDGYVMCCGDQFFEKDLLVDHILMHVNNRRQMKKISCEHCEQFFYRKRFYTRHLLKVHSNDSADARNNSLNSSANSIASSSATPITTPTQQRNTKIVPTQLNSATTTPKTSATTTVTLGHTTYIITAAPNSNKPSAGGPGPVGIATKAGLTKLSSVPQKTVISTRVNVSANHETQPDDELMVLTS